MGREFELKYAATQQQLQAIAARYGDFTTIEMVTSYYDTTDSALAARYITLRRRMENGISICTLKTPTGSIGRHEWEVVETDIRAAIPELCKLSQQDVLLSLLSDGVVEICGARFTRLAKTLVLQDCTVELALDDGILTGANREEALCEVEVELKDGSEDAAIAFAQQLAEEFSLTAEFKSKFRRALNLTYQEAHHG